MSLMYLFKVSKQFISSVLPAVLKAIIQSTRLCQGKFFITLFFNATNFLHSTLWGEICITVLVCV
jgi:hypothetical protein